MRLRLLGTGASGGTPGRGRSARLESSALVRDGAGVLVDVTRHFHTQSAAIERLDAVLLTHAHRDAAGGVGALRRWWRGRGLAAPIPVYSHARTLAALESRNVRLDHCQLVPAEPGQLCRVRDFEVSALQVPHAADPRFPTFAWRLESGSASLVYASDVARRMRGPRAATSRRRPAAAPRRKGKGRAAPDFPTGFAARRSRGEMVDTEEEIYRASTPPDVTSVRAKSQRHRKSTADRRNQ